MIAKSLRVALVAILMHGGGVFAYHGGTHITGGVLLGWLKSENLHVRMAAESYIDGVLDGAYVARSLTCKEPVGRHGVYTTVQATLESKFDVRDDHAAHGVFVAVETMGLCTGPKGRKSKQVR